MDARISLKNITVTGTIFFAITLLFISSCHSQKETRLKTEGDKSDSLVISMNAYPCFGRCPYFEAKIFDSGYTLIDRKGFMDELGLYSTMFSQADIKKILKEAKRIEYAAMADSFYNQGIADFPATITSVKQNGTRKTIFNGVPDSPKTLGDFQVMLRNLLTSEERQWKLIRKKEAD